MIEPRKTLGPKEIFVLIFVFIIAADVAIFLNIPFLRQIFGFLFITILPGVLILQILKLNKIGSTEKFVLVVGLSISFLMLFGLLINNLSLSLGYETPLATIPLLISFNIAFLMLLVIGYKVNKEPVVYIPNLNLSTSEKAFLIVPILFPALSIFGMHVMNTTYNNTILMLLLFSIPIYVAFVCFFNQKIPKRLYPVVIYLISISLLLLMALRLNHLIGVDIHAEFYFFQMALKSLHWKVLGNSTLDACLAISLLPTIYHSILNIPSEILFKILYSLLFSISPLIVYILSKKYVGEIYGFLASCFFMFQQYFLFAAFYPRTITAVLFFALAMMTLFSDRIDPLRKKIFFIVFMTSCMLSHYSTTYIFFFILLGAFVGTVIVSQIYTTKKVVSLTITFLFFALIFLWYSQVTETAFYAGVHFVEKTLTNLNMFFVGEMRSTSAHAMLGGGIWQKGIPHKIEFVLTWLMFAFIGIGIVTLIRNYKKMSFPGLKFTKPDFLREKFEVTYFMISLVCSGLLVAIVALPFVSVGYGMTRVYAIATVLLSVFFVIGGIKLSQYSKIRAYIIILIVLIPYFFCVTGVSYQVFGVPRAITLNSEGEQYDMYYVHDQDSCAAKWLGDHIEKRQRIYTDFIGGDVLMSQGLIPLAFMYRTFPVENKKKGQYIFLRYYNLIRNEILVVRKGGASEIYNTSDYIDIFIKNNMIYDNSVAKIWI